MHNTLFMVLKTKHNLSIFEPEIKNPLSIFEPVGQNEYAYKKKKHVREPFLFLYMQTISLTRASHFTTSLLKPPFITNEWIK